MKKVVPHICYCFLPSILVIALYSLPLTAYAQMDPIAEDSASDSAYSGGSWAHNSNGGYGFSAWSITMSANDWNGAYTGNPNDKGLSGMPNPSWGMYAHTGDTWVNADRSFSTPMRVGDIFSFKWAFNWDSGSGGNKGFNIYVGATEVINVNNAGSPNITVNGNNTGFAYGTAAMTWTITYQNANTLHIRGTSRSGGSDYTTTVTVSGAPTAFRFYISRQGDNNGNREPFFNDLKIQPTVKFDQTGVSGSLGTSTITYPNTTTVTASGGQGTGAYEFRQNGGSGAVAFSGSGASRTITPTTAGTAIIEVRRLGDNNYNDSAWMSAGTLTINKANQTITFAEGAWQTKADTDSPFTLTASASSGLPVSFASSDTGIATVSANTVTIVDVGVTTITASQAGNDNYNAASNVERALTVRPIDATWTGGGGDNNALTEANWNQNLYPYVGANTIMRFAGATRLTPNINFTAGSAFGAIYFQDGAEPFTLSGNALTIHSAIQNNSDDTQTIENNLELGANVIVQTTGAGDLILSGVISGTAQITAESGAGAVRLTNPDNTYSGTTTVKDGAILGGSGNASSDTTVESGGAISPGASIGTFATKDLTLEAGSEYICDISGENHDQIIVSGTLYLPTCTDKTTIVIPGTSTITPNTFYPIIQASGGVDGGSAANITVDDETGFTPGFNVHVDHNEDGGVTLEALPEPGVLGIALLSALALLRMRLAHS